MKFLILVITLLFAFTPQSKASLSKQSLMDEIKKHKKIAQQDLQNIEKCQIDIIHSSRNIETKDSDLINKKVQEVSIKSHKTIIKKVKF